MCERFRDVGLFVPLTPVVAPKKPILNTVKGFFSKCDQIYIELQIWGHLMKKSLMEIFAFCVMVFRIPSSTYDSALSSQKYRSSRWETFVKKGFFKKFARFTGKNLCWSFLLVKLETCRPPTLLKRHSETGAFL